MLPEQSTRAKPLWIKNVHQWVSVLGQTCGKDDQLVVFGHLFEELCRSGSHLDKNLVLFLLKQDSQDEVTLGRSLKLGTH